MYGYTQLYIAIHSGTQLCMAINSHYIAIHGYTHPYIYTHPYTAMIFKGFWVRRWLEGGRKQVFEGLQRRGDFSPENRIAHLSNHRTEISQKIYAFCFTSRSKIRPNDPELALEESQNPTLSKRSKCVANFHVPLYSYVWLCIALHSCVQLCMAIYIAVCSHVSLCIDMYCYV